jgi:hypothetical protein
MFKKILLVMASCLVFCSAAYATFNSGSTGTDGPFNPTASMEVVLPPDGVLNYTTVDIPAGVTVTFKKNAANTPVFMLATGDVNIAGTIDVAGKGATSLVPGAGGPGGFAGGYGGGFFSDGGKGQGPGGGNPGRYYGGMGGGGGFGTVGLASAGGTNGTGGPIYGTSTLLPLIGGSGGGGGAGHDIRSGGPGGGGGGALMIASSTVITVTGTIKANGGNGSTGPEGWGNNTGAGGSGGAIRLMANVISGNGTIDAKNGTAGYSVHGGMGRIRLETYTNNRTASTVPAYTLGLPSIVFPPSSPTLSITSIAGTTVPASPTGSYNQPDMLLPSTTTNPVTVNISANNIPVGTTVKVWTLPQYGSATSVNTTLTGTNESSAATANVNLSTTYSNVVTAEATFTILQAMYWNGEEIDKVKVATRMGGGSETVYITRSGKEIPGDLVVGAYR